MVAVQSSFAYIQGVQSMAAKWSSDFIQKPC